MCHRHFCLTQQNTYMPTLQPMSDSIQLENNKYMFGFEKFKLFIDKYWSSIVSNITKQRVIPPSQKKNNKINHQTDVTAGFGFENPSHSL